MLAPEPRICHICRWSSGRIASTSALAASSADAKVLWTSAGRVFAAGTGPAAPAHGVVSARQPMTSQPSRRTTMRRNRVVIALSRSQRCVAARRLGRRAGRRSEWMAGLCRHRCASAAARVAASSRGSARPCRVALDLRPRFSAVGGLRISGREAPTGCAISTGPVAGLVMRLSHGLGSWPVPAARLVASSCPCCRSCLLHPA